MNAQPKFTTVMVGRVRWSVAADCVEPFFGPTGLLRPVLGPAALGLPAGLPIDAWLSEGRATVIKHGAHRTVYRLHLDDFDLYLKHNRVHNARALLRQLIRPSKSRMECDRARLAASRGVSTITPLAVGETGSLWPGDSFLITRTLDNVQPLDSFLQKTLPFLPEPRQSRLRQGVAVVLGQFVARMHDAGICHNDLHIGNLLLRLDAADRPSLYLIDLHTAQIGSPLTWTASRENLFIMGRWFTVRADRADRRRFLEAYAAARTDWNSQPPTRPMPQLARDLEKGTWASNLWFWRNRDGRCLASNRYFQRITRGPVKGHAVRDLDREDLTRLMLNADEPFERDPSALIKDSPTSAVVEVSIKVGGVERAAIFKRFQVTRWTDSLVALVRPTGALRSWVMGQGLRERCLPTPKPLAVFHRLKNGCPKEGYLLVEKVEEARELGQFVNDLDQFSPSYRRIKLRRIIERLAGLVRELHRRQLSHRDLKAANILVTGDQLWFIDLVGVRRHHRLGYRRKVQNLARIHASFFRHPGVTRADKVRFLKVYMQWGLFGRKGWKALWREVEQATLAKVARNVRVGRTLS